MYLSYTTVISDGETLSTSYSARVLPFFAARRESVVCCKLLPVSMLTEGSSVPVTPMSSLVTLLVMSELPVILTSVALLLILNTRTPASCAVSEISTLIGTLRITVARLSELLAIMANQTAAAARNEKISKIVLFSNTRKRCFTSFLGFLDIFAITSSPSFCFSARRTYGARWKLLPAE